MENYSEKNQKKIEGFTIVIYILYVLTMVYLSKQQEWPSCCQCNDDLLDCRCNCDFGKIQDVSFPCCFFRGNDADQCGVVCNLLG